MALLLAGSVLRDMFILYLGIIEIANAVKHKNKSLPGMFKGGETYFKWSYSVV
jgi:hypothetical protein